MLEELAVAQCIPFILLYIFLPLLLLWYSSRRPANFPDGPSGLPMVGVIPFLGNRPEVTFMKWSKQYGNVIGLNMGRKLAVVLNDYEAIHQALVRQGNHFSYRPRNMLFDKIGKGSGISMINYTEAAKLQRNFILNSLRKFGFARKSMESSIVDEAKYLIDAIRECDCQYRKAEETMLNAVANVICQLVFGRRFEYDDNANFLYVARLLTRMNADECLTIQAVMMLPFMRFYPPMAKGIRRMARTYDEVYKFIGNFIEEHKGTVDHTNSRDFLDDYLTEIKKHEKEKSTIYTEMMLLGVVRDFFVGGLETTNTTLKWLLLILANRPALQEKIYQEIVDVVGSSGRATMAHREKMPFVQAAIHEISRFRPVVPLALPHSTSHDTKLFGRDIPKGTTVIVNLFAVNHDPNVWKDPDKFVVERHFDENGAVVNFPELLSFSIGPRACIGAQLAKMEIFLILVTLLQAFKIEPVNSGTDLEEPIQSGLVLSPPNVQLFTFVER